ncbi:MAG: UDP-N-acetylmuramoyl-tripeptide--D-alanyl-D-alanine ligase, partial [Clostridia bacterium]|nr:UDP-N-acetylmuramoyl-tripeptide--D-alanyl-D-alanine ligase [Clostridia bacterium]
LSSQFLDIYGYGAIALTPIMLPLLVPFVHWIMKPTEKAINRSYVKKSKEKLSETPNLIKIGITGSFGKTSTKNFLNTLLSEKYSVCVTPANFNTPMGITKTVLQCLAPLHQVLIAEMGARQVGDIKELCEIVEPQYGIVTAVGEQHMATFQSIDNIRRTKAELAEYLAQNGGYCVFDGDNEITKKIYDSVNCDKSIISTTDKQATVYATNIKVSTNGTSFDLNIKDMESIHVDTKLFGEHNINNLLLCVDLAIKLGLSREELMRGLGRIMPVEHRLQLIQAENDVIILDDAYNASIEGSKRALEVMSMWKDRRKIVITPGLVELGTMERIANYELGKRIAKVADIVIIVNKVHFLSVKQGLLDEKFDESKIYNADNVTSAVNVLNEILQPKDIVLWENDLPDNYT